MSIKDLKDNMGKGTTSSERGVSWKPKEVGDELAGIIETISYVHTDFGDKYILNIRDDEDDTVLWTLWVDGVVLKNRLLEMAPGVGSLIVIQYKGKKDNKASTYKYNDFEVAVDKPDCHDEWMAVKEAFAKRSLLKEEDAMSGGGGGIGPADDPMAAPF